MAGNGMTHSATQKIVNLSRKNRDLHADLTKERSKVRQLQSQLSQLKTQDQKPEESQPPLEPSQEQHLKETITHLEEQLTQTRQKVVDYSNQCQILKQDVKFAQKALSKEIGDGTSINSLMSNTGWRGRAQQIITLQNKVSELQRQLASHRKAPSFQSTHLTSSDEKQRSVVHKIEKENKVKFQDIKSELDVLRTEHVELKQQCNALKARNKTLTTDCKELRNQVSLLNQELRNNAKQSTGLDNTKERKEIVYEELEEVIKDLHSQLNLNKEENKHLKETINRLQNELQANRSVQDRPTCTSLHSTITNEDKSCPNDTVDCGYSNNELKLPPIRVRNSRISQRECPIRSSMSAEGMSLRKCSSIEMEEVSTRLRVAEVERDRLIGLSELLQKRLDDSNTKLLTVQCEMCTLKQEYSLKNKEGGTSSKTRNIMSVESLKERLSLQEDENQVLRETLQLTRQQRLEDGRHFHSILDETRRLFSEAIQTIKDSTKK